VTLSHVDVTFRLADGGSYPAVAQASLSVADGELVAIVGPTGCGKSTLLNIAAGLMAPSAGRVEVFGKALVGLNRQAGYLFQAEALFPWKTALENVAIGLEIAGTPRREASGRKAGLAGLDSPVSASAIRTCCRAGRGSGWVSFRCSYAIRKSC
jgi:NitT/TauT family transport system ATP-binding protein